MELTVGDPPQGAAAEVRQAHVPGDSGSGSEAARPAPTARRSPGPDEAVVYFHGCAANYYEPHVADAAIEVLRRNGFAGDRPAPGLLRPADDQQRPVRERPRAGRRRTPAVLADVRPRRATGSSGPRRRARHTFKAEYEEMLDLHDDDTRAVAQATWDICEFLLDLHEQGRLDTSFGALDEDLPYHAPCQLRSHGIGLAGARAVRPRAGPARRGHGPRLLRDRGHVRAQEGEVRHRDGGRRAAVREDPGDRAPPRRPATPRRAAGRSSPRPASGPATRSRSCSTPTAPADAAAG